ncbi:MAG: hypothetical protein UHD64_05680 [Bacteroidales bacterium]|nr:hypothetical protein [Bacteroidales bacterium]
MNTFNNRVVAVRIYYGLNFTPMADLKMTDGVVETIQWTDIKQRKEFEGRMNGYTLFYDEREKASFENL